MKDYLNLGPTPYEEDCVQVGENDYRNKALKECNRYINLLKKRFPNQPENAQFKIKGFPHDFGRYFEVIIEYQDDDPDSIQYAFMVENSCPGTWNDSEIILLNVNEEI